VTVHVSDESGEPAGGAYVRYHYEGSILNFVDSLSYVARGSAITRADADGRATIPGRLHVRSPLRVTWPPEVFLDHVYVPRLHNAIGPIPSFALTRPGAANVEPEYRITLFDLSEAPDLWERSLHQLYDFVRESIQGRAPLVDPTDGSAVLLRELIGHLRAEHAALVARHRDTPRARYEEPPSLSPEERAAWNRRVDEDLSSEPTWGPYIERTWRGRLAYVLELEGRLQHSLEEP
jgi:hypothetical protein